MSRLSQIEEAAEALLAQMSHTPLALKVIERGHDLRAALSLPPDAPTPPSECCRGTIDRIDAEKVAGWALDRLARTHPRPAPTSDTVAEIAKLVEARPDEDVVAVVRGHLLRLMNERSDLTERVRTLEGSARALLNAVRAEASPTGTNYEEWLDGYARDMDDALSQANDALAPRCNCYAFLPREESGAEIASALAAERERCARECDGVAYKHTGVNHAVEEAARRCAARIRALGAQSPEYTPPSGFACPRCGRGDPHDHYEPPASSWWLAFPVGSDVEVRASATIFVSDHPRGAWIPGRVARIEGSEHRPSAVAVVLTPHSFQDSVAYAIHEGDVRLPATPRPALDASQAAMREWAHALLHACDEHDDDAVQRPARDRVKRSDLCCDDIIARVGPPPAHDDALRKACAVLDEWIQGRDPSHIIGSTRLAVRGGGLTDAWVADTARGDVGHLFDGSLARLITDLSAIVQRAKAAGGAT